MASQVGEVTLHLSARYTQHSSSKGWLCIYYLSAGLHLNGEKREEEERSGVCAL